MKKFFVTFGITALVAFGIYEVGSVIFADDDSTRFLKGRPWVDHLPKDAKDKVHVLFLANDSPFGATVHGSNYRHLVNSVPHNLDGETLRIVSLQDNLKVAVKVRTWACDDAPKGLDLCMEMSVRGRKIRLYSATEWERGESTPEYLQRMNIRSETSFEESNLSEVPEGTPAWFLTAASP